MFDLWWQGLTGLVFRNCGNSNSVGAALKISGSTSITVTNCTFESNLNKFGVVFVGSGTTTFRDVIFTDNVGSAGGAVSISLSSQGDHVLFDQCRFERNRAIGVGAATCGGAVLVQGDNCVVHFEQCIFEGNRAVGPRSSGGGAMFMQTGTMVTSNGTSYTNNTAVGGQGGAIIVAGGNLTCTGCKFSQNQMTKAAGGGGALLVWNSAPSNIPEAGGGAIAMDSASVVTFNKSNFTGNTAVGGGGGAVYMDGGELSCTSCHFEFNQVVDALRGGGAVYLQQNAAARVDARANLNSSSFSNNRAPGSSGGALFAHIGAFLECHGCQFEMNHASLGGAVASTAGCSVRLDETVYLSNSADANGGALWLTLSEQFLWPQACSLVETVQATNNSALQAGGFAFFDGLTQNSQSCVDQLTSLADSYGSAGLYGNGVATSPARTVILSTQGIAYNPADTIQVHPIEPITMQVSIVDAFGQPCLQEPALGVNIKPQPSSIKFMGSMQAVLNSTGIASYAQHSTILLLQGAQDNNSISV